MKAKNRIVLTSLIGLILVGSWLAGWHWLSNDANYFAPATAIFGLGGGLLSFWPPLQKRPLAAYSLKIAGLVGIGIALLASFSLGAFMPAGIAEWVSPVLAKFGGGLALAIIATSLLITVLTGLVKEKRSLVLDLAMACGLASLWVSQQVAQQASFPPPPTSDILLAPRFDFMLVTAVALTGLSLLVRWLGPKTGWLDGNIFGGWLGRWSTYLAVLGTVAGFFTGYPNWYLDVILLVINASIFILSQFGVEKKVSLNYWRVAGWIGVVVAVSALAYFSVSEDLEVALLRNTAEHYALQNWRDWFGDERFQVRPTGALNGKVTRENGQPLPGAVVVVSTVSGQIFSAKSDANGNYTLPSVPTDNYLPMAVAPGYQQAATGKFGGRVATVRGGSNTSGVDFRLTPGPALQLKPNTTLKIAAPSLIAKDNPEPSTAQRFSFTFENRGKLLEGGLIHEPPPEMGPGPFPILLIIYPGPASAWEGVSVPLAAKGYVVVSFFPNRLLDLEGDLDDLRQLIGLSAAGQMSSRSDPTRLALVGGSVSTAYTYLMAQELENSPIRPDFKATVEYGGIIDLFQYRNSWEKGEVVIDPGISALESMLVAFGRPDTRPELYLRFSPAYRLDAASLPPTLLVHVSKDIIVPVMQTYNAEAVFKGLNIPHEVLIYPELEHYLDMSKRDPAYADMLNQTLAFLKKYG